MDITELLGFSVKQGASDLHITAGMPPLIRVDGDIRRINVPEMDGKEVHALIYEIMNDKQRKDYEEFMETDFYFEVPNLARFRVNAFMQNRGRRPYFEPSLPRCWQWKSWVWVRYSRKSPTCRVDWET